MLMTFDGNGWKWVSLVVFRFEIIDKFHWKMPYSGCLGPQRSCGSLQLNGCFLESWAKITIWVYNAMVRNRCWQQQPPFKCTCALPSSKAPFPRRRPSPSRTESSSLGASWPAGPCNGTASGAMREPNNPVDHTMPSKWDNGRAVLPSIPSIV